MVPRVTANPIKNTIKETFLRNIVFEKGHYDYNCLQLLNGNYAVAKKCLKQQLRMLWKNPELLSTYTKATKEQTANEVIKIPPKETPVSGKNYVKARSKTKKIVQQPKLGEFHNSSNDWSIKSSNQLW